MQKTTIKQQPSRKWEVKELVEMYRFPFFCCNRLSSGLLRALDDLVIEPRIIFDTTNDDLESQLIAANELQGVKRNANAHIHAQHKN